VARGLARPAAVGRDPATRRYRHAAATVRGKPAGRPAGGRPSAERGREAIPLTKETWASAIAKELVAKEDRELGTFRKLQSLQRENGLPSEIRIHPVTNFWG
jgi:hypothetical protein